MSLGRTVNCWETFEKENKGKEINSVAIIGYNYSGKSTFCELSMSFIGGKRNKQLVFDDGKIKQYVLPKIISSNALKVETIIPQQYAIENTEKGKLLDVPAFCTVPFNETLKKQWTTLDAKISFFYLTKTVKKCSFVLTLEEKYTRQSMDGLKNMITTFIQMYERHPQQLLNSTALMLTKCPLNSKKDTYFTRLDTCVKKFQEHPQAKAIQEWIKNIKDRNALFLFSKFTSDEQTAKDEVKNIYKDMMALSRYQNRKQNLVEIRRYPKQLQEDIEKYLNDIQIFFEKFVRILKNVMNGHYNKVQHFVEDKEKNIQELMRNEQKKESKKKEEKEEEISKKEQNQVIPSFFAVLSLCQQIEKMLQDQIIETEVDKINFLKKVLKKFISISLLNEDDIIINFIEEKFNFYLTFQDHCEWSTDLTLQNIEVLNTFKNDENLVDQFLQIYQENQSIEYEKNVKKAIQYLKPMDQLANFQQLSKIWIKTTLQIGKQEKSSSALQNFLSLQDFLNSSGNTSKMGDLLDSIGQILVKQKFFSLAINLFGLSGNPNRAIQIFKPIIEKCSKKDSLQDFLTYAQFLKSAGLFEECMKFLYLLGSHFGEQEERQILGKFLQKLESSPKKIDINFLNSFMKKEVKGIDKEYSNKIKEAAKQIKKNEEEEEKNRAS